MLLQTCITHRFPQAVIPAMRSTARQIHISKAWIALSVILTPEGCGMTIRRRLQPAMNAMRIRVLPIRIRRPVIVLNVTLMPETSGWVQPMTIHRLRHHVQSAMRTRVPHPRIHRRRIARSVTPTPAALGSTMAALPALAARSAMGTMPTTSSFLANSAWEQAPLQATLLILKMMQMILKGRT